MVDAFFVGPDIAKVIKDAGISGVTIEPAVDHRTGTELSGRVQLAVPTILAGAESSRWPPVTCKAKNEEAMAIERLMAKWPKRVENPQKTTTLAPGDEESLRKCWQRMAKIPFCERVKHHSPTTLSINSKC